MFVHQRLPPISLRPEDSEGHLGQYRDPRRREVAGFPLTVRFENLAAPPTFAASARVAAGRQERRRLTWPRMAGVPLRRAVCRHRQSGRLSGRGPRENRYRGDRCRRVSVPDVRSLSLRSTWCAGHPPGGVHQSVLHAVGLRAASRSAISALFTRSPPPPSCPVVLPDYP